MAQLEQEQIRRLRQAMLERQRILAAEVREKRNHAATEDNAQAAGGVGDTGDESVSRMITDIDLQEASRDSVELREIEAALGRMDDATYGLCSECAAVIDYRRLEAQPAALRCVACQEKHEKMYAHGSTPRL